MTRRNNFQALCLTVLGSALLSGASGDVLITGSDVWRAADGPRVIRGVVTVAEGASLTIEAGTTVEFSGDFRSGLEVRGRLRTNGSTQNPVTLRLTATNDTRRSLYWRGIWMRGADARVELASTAITRAVTGVENRGGIATLDSVSVTESVRATESAGISARTTVSGGTLERNSFGIDSFGGAEVSASSVTFRFNRTGVFSRDAKVELRSNSFECNQFPVVTGNRKHVMGSGNRLLREGRPSEAAVESMMVVSEGDAASGKRVDAAVLSDTTWTGADSPVLVSGEIEVRAGVTLTIQKGVVVRFLAGGGSGLLVNGRLVVAGTSEQPVYMTSSLDPATSVERFPTTLPGVGPMAGDWTGIRFGSTQSTSSIEHAVVRYAGQALSAEGTGPLSVSDSTLRDSLVGLGVSLQPSSVSASRVSFVRNGVGVGAMAGRTLLASPSFVSNGVATSGEGSVTCAEGTDACKVMSESGFAAPKPSPRATTAFTNLMPSFSTVPFSGTSPSWPVSRYAPATFAQPGGGTGQAPFLLGIGIDQAQGYSNRPAAYQSQLYGYQGRSHAVAGSGSGDAIAADLYIPSTLGDTTQGNAATYMWAVGSKGGAESDYAIIGFTNSVGHGEYTVWDETSQGWIDLPGTVSYNAWNAFSIQFTGSTFDYYVNGTKVYSMANQFGSSLVSGTIMDAVNFFDPTTSFTGRNYGVGWSDTHADLAISKSHSGSFYQGQAGAGYTIVVTNSGSGATSGTVTVTDTVPTGLTATALTGQGWTCSLTSVSCSRTDSLAGGSSYPPISVTVNVANNAPAAVTNVATVALAGEVTTGNNTASDPTLIIPIPDMSISMSHSAPFVQGQSGATYMITASNVGGAATNAPVTVSATLPVGLTATSITGVGWQCGLPSVPAPTAWYRASSFSTSTSTWVDSSANHLDLQAAGSPSINTSGLNGQPTVVLPGGSYFASSSGVPGTIWGAGTTGKVFAVLKQSGSSPYNTAFSWASNGSNRFLLHATWGGVIYFQDGAGCCSPNNTTAATEPSGWNDTFHLLEVTNGMISVDGISLTVTYQGGATPLDTTQPATLYVGNDIFGNIFHGEIAEIVAYNRSLSANEEQSVNAYLNQKYFGTSSYAAPLSCSRSDALVAGASYPPITIAVNVAATAVSPLTSSATVSGGGEANTANNSATDVTVVGVPACLVPPSGLVGWWPGDGNANDLASGNGGTLSGGAITAAGLVGGAFSFDGTSGQLQIPSSQPL